MAHRFRLLQISDLHLATTTYFSERGLSYLRHFRFQNLVERKWRPARLAQLRSVARAAYLTKPLDAILITGDLANWGDSESLKAAYEFVTSEPVRGWHDASRRPTLRGSQVPVHLLPGNHDRYGPWGYGGTSGILFDEVFPEYWDVGQSVSAFILGEALGIVMGDLTLTTMLHGTSLPGGVWGQGKAYVERIAFLKAKTELLRARHPDLAIIWAVHFAPAFEGLPMSLALIDDGRLIAAAAEMGVHQILCGHTHEQRHYKVGPGESVTVFCVGSASQPSPEANTLHLFDIEVDRGAFSRFDVEVLEHDAFEGFRPR